MPKNKKRVRRVVPPERLASLSGPRSLVLLARVSASLVPMGGTASRNKELPGRCAT